MCTRDKTGYIHHHHHHSVTSTQTLPTLTQRRFYKTQSYQTDFPAKYRTVVYFYVWNAIYSYRHQQAVSKVQLSSWKQSSSRTRQTGDNAQRMTQSPYCHFYRHQRHAELGRCRSNRMGVSRGSQNWGDAEPRPLRMGRVWPSRNTLLHPQVLPLSL